MCNAIMDTDVFPFVNGEEVDVEYFGICSGSRVYVVRKITDPNISEVIFETFLRLMKSRPIPSLAERGYT